MAGSAGRWSPSLPGDGAPTCIVPLAESSVWVPMQVLFLSRQAMLSRSTWSSLVAGLLSVRPIGPVPLRVMLKASGQCRPEYCSRPQSRKQNTFFFLSNFWGEIVKYRKVQRIRYKHLTSTTQN